MTCSRWAALLCWLALSGAPCRGQVVRLLGGAGTGDAAGGAGVSVLQADSTTTLGLGLTQGIHVSFRRTVEVGSDTLAVGDSTLQLSLPTDLESTPRTFVGRGMLLQHNQEHGSTFFAGATGSSFSNSYAESIAPTHFVGVLASELSLAGTTVSTLNTYFRGSRNMLVSISRNQNPFRKYAVTVGTSDGSTIFRASTHQQGVSFRVDAGYNAGELKLQPVSDGQSATLERIGWNVIASRNLGRHLLLDAARHQYVTSNAGADPTYRGVAGARSQLLEGGASLHAAQAQLYWRELLSTSATQQGRASIWVAAWTARLWRIQALYTRNVNREADTRAGPAKVSNDAHGLQVQATEHIRGRLQMTETADLSGSPDLNLGGAWDGDHIAVAVTQREAYVPFGASRGFHAMQTISVQLRLRSGDTGAAITRGGGMPVTVIANTDNYFGGMGSEIGAAAASSHISRLMVHGRVVDGAQKPIAGAAVRAGNQVVFTNSEGEFLARFSRAQSVPVSLELSQFLTAQPYRALSTVVPVSPRSDGGEPLLLKAEVCMPCATNPAAQASSEVPATTQEEMTEAETPFAHTRHLLVRLLRRMLRFRAG